MNEKIGGDIIILVVAARVVIKHNDKSLSCDCLLKIGISNHLGATKLQQ